MINPAPEDAPNTHNMMLVDSAHRFQVILGATFTDGDRNLTEVYFKDRRKNLAVKMYTLSPGQFVLSHVDPNGSALKKFSGNA